MLSSPLRNLTTSSAFISMMSGKPLPAIRVAGNFLFIASRERSSYDMAMPNFSLNSGMRDSYSGLWFSAWNQKRMGMGPVAAGVAASFSTTTVCSTTLVTSFSTSTTLVTSFSTSTTLGWHAASTSPALPMPR